MSFTVTVVEGDEPFTIDFRSTVEDAFNLIRQSYPDIKGRFRVITNETEKEILRDLRPTDSFPADDNNKRVVFILARQAPHHQRGTTDTFQEHDRERETHRRDRERNQQGKSKASDIRGRFRLICFRYK